LARFVFIAVLIFTFCIGIITSAQARQYDQYLQRQQDLVSLAGIFGGLHHIRRTCNPRREANIWRERMQNLIEFEEPDNDTHLGMVNAFNENFQSARSSYPDCTRNTQEAGKNLAFEGNKIVQRLTSPLRGEVIQTF